VSTLHQCGFLEKVAGNQYRPRFSLRPRQRYTLGYAAHGQEGL
jgi:hypothetical protein